MKIGFIIRNQKWCGKDADHGRTTESSTRDSAAEKQYTSIDQYPTQLMYIDISLSRSNTEVCDLKIGKLETIKIDTIRYNIKEGSTFTMNEHHLYGSSRLGMEQKNEFLAFSGDNIIIDSLRTTVYTDNDSTISTSFISSSTEAEDTLFTALDSVWIKNLGLKKYELSNHLGNVMTVISDRKLGIDSTENDTADYYLADVVSATDYYPFGFQMPGRSFTSESYRYGYQGSEKDFDVAEGDYTTHFRMLDTRLGRWFSVDPKATAFESPYVSMGNNPISYNDSQGDTTAVYSSKGKYLTTIQDKNSFQVLVLNSKHDNSVHYMLKSRHFQQKSCDNQYDFLKGRGLTYNTKSFEQFYDKYVNAFPIESIDGHSIANADVFLNDKQIYSRGKALGKPLFAESVGYLDVKDGEVSINNDVKPESSKDLFFANPYNMPKIHPHPDLGSGTVFYKGIGGDFKDYPVESEAGPSPTDYNTAKKNTNEVRDVAVDKNNIYIYNGSSSETITIPKE